MRYPGALELPDRLVPLFRKAKKLEWITVGYLLSVVVLMFLVMGTSQAMKSAWLEDMLSLFPAISFLVASAVYSKAPNRDFPYGYHRAFGIAFLAGSVALFGMGFFLALDSLSVLLHAEHPTIGSMFIFGTQVWMGWVMIAVLLYSAIPAMILGIKKLPLAKKLHNKILYTDADAQKADYQTAFAAIAGIVGIGFGLWWADAAAALFISFSVLWDGYTNLKNAIRDLADRRPIHVHHESPDELVSEIGAFVASFEWVVEARPRLREHGQVLMGEVFVVVREGEEVPRRIEEGMQQIKGYHWRAYDIVVVPVLSLPDH